MDYIMNYIKASVTSIDSFEGITIVGFRAGSEVLTMMSLELDRSLQVGSAVMLAFKATTVSLARDKNALLSISNQLPVYISSIDKGELLSSVKLSFEGSFIESIITKSSALRMDLKPEDEIVALIKASDLAIAEIL
jgi:molybdopterin-binding protein